jgi:hypothetical protein
MKGGKDVFGFWLGLAWLADKKRKRPYLLVLVVARASEREREREGQIYIYWDPFQRGAFCHVGS